MCINASLSVCVTVYGLTFNIDKSRSLLIKHFYYFPFVLLDCTNPFLGYLHSILDTFNPAKMSYLIFAIGHTYNQRLPRGNQRKNLRMVEVGRNLWRWFGPSPQLMQEYLEQVAQNHVKGILEYLKNGNYTMSLGNLLYCSITLREGKQFFIRPLPLVLFLGTSAFIFFAPFLQVCINTDKILQDSFQS